MFPKFSTHQLQWKKCIACVSQCSKMEQNIVRTAWEWVKRREPSPYSSIWKSIATVLFEWVNIHINRWEGIVCLTLVWLTELGGGIFGSYAACRSILTTVGGWYGVVASQWRCRIQDSTHEAVMLDADENWLSKRCPCALSCVVTNVWEVMVLNDKSALNTECQPGILQADDYLESEYSRLVAPLELWSIFSPACLNTFCRKLHIISSFLFLHKLPRILRKSLCIW